ncbi:unnamed protein product [Lampetra fluviatilis]
MFFIRGSRRGGVARSGAEQPSGKTATNEAPPPQMSGAASRVSGGRVSWAPTLMMANASRGSRAWPPRLPDDGAAAINIHSAFVVKEMRAA